MNAGLPGARALSIYQETRIQLKNLERAVLSAKPPPPSLAPRSSEAKEDPSEPHRPTSAPWESRHCSDKSSRSFWNKIHLADVPNSSRQPLQPSRRHNAHGVAIVLLVSCCRRDCLPST